MLPVTTSLLLAVAVGSGDNPGASEHRDTQAESAMSGWPVVLNGGVLGGFTATANEPQTALIGGIDGWNVSSLLEPNASVVYPMVALWLAVETEVVPWLGLRFLGDTGEIRPGSSLLPEVDGLASNGSALEDAFTSGAWIRELTARVSGLGIRIDVGRQRVAVAQGLVYDTFGTGGTLALDFGSLGGPSFRLDAAALVVGERWEEIGEGSLLFSGRMGYELSLFESLGVYVAHFIDPGGALAGVVRSVVAESVIEDVTRESVEQNLLSELLDENRPSAGSLTYIGADFSVLPGLGMSMRGAVVTQFGTLEASRGDNTVARLQLWSAAGQLEVHQGLGEHWDVGLFALYLGGDDAPRRSNDTPRYGGFIGIAPYWVWTGLFFSGGLSQGLYPGRATAAGVNGHGVTGAGTSVSWFGSKGSVEVRGIPLLALSAPPMEPVGGTGRWYGVELDLRLQWEIEVGLTWGVEADFLIPGDFFPRNAIAFRVVSVASVSWAYD